MRILIVIPFLFLCQCSKTFLAQGQDPKDFFIKYTKSSGWTGYKLMVTVEQDCQMTIEESNPISNEKRSDTLLLEKRDCHHFSNHLLQLSETDIESKYGFGINRPTDLPVTKISFQINKSKDSTFIYGNTHETLPQSLQEIIKKIQALVNSRK